MHSFSCRVMTDVGPKDLTIEADTEAEARSTAFRYGIPIRVRRSLYMGSRRLTRDERITLLTQLATMLGSGLGVTEALSHLRDSFAGRIRHVATHLLSHMERSGLDLAEAMRRVGRQDFPETTVSLIAAGVQGGSSHQAVQNAVQFEREMAEVLRTSGRGLWGAIGAFFLAGIVTFLASGPVSEELMSSSIMKGYADQVDTGWVDLMADVTQYSMALIMSIFVAVFGIATAGRKLLPVPADRLILQIPVVRDLVLSRPRYTAFSGLAYMLNSGVPEEEALELAKYLAPPGVIRSDFEEGAAAVRDGRNFATGMRTLMPTSRAVLLTVADRTEKAKALSLIGQHYRNLYIDRMAVFVPTAQLTAALFLAVAGAVLFGKTILPMLQVSQGIIQ